MKRVFIILLSTTLLAACHTQTEDVRPAPTLSEEEENIGEYDGSIPQSWWFLFSEGDPEIVLRDLATHEDLRVVNVPEALKSPSALTFDGSHLYVGGSGEGAGIYKLDPVTGVVVETYPNINVRALAWSDNKVWYLEGETLQSISENGKPGESYTLDLPENFRSMGMRRGHAFLFHGDLGTISKVNLESGAVVSESVSGMEDANSFQITQISYVVTIPTGYVCSWGIYGQGIIDIPLGPTGNLVTAMAPNDIEL